MKRADKWAKLVYQFHDMSETRSVQTLMEDGATRTDNQPDGLVFADACICGGRTHQFGLRPDGRGCPARAGKKQQEKMKALGQMIESGKKPVVT